MGYDVHITRAEHWSDNADQWIATDEWLRFVEADPELSLDPRHPPHFAIWSGKSTHEEPWLDWSEGNIYTKNPDDALILKMIAIARSLGAKVQGDDGEVYPIEPSDTRNFNSSPRAYRSLVPEQMDAPAANPAALRRALRFIRRINSLLRYNAATIKAIAELGGGSVLDVACGSADLATELGGTRYVGLDLHPQTLAFAQEWQPKAALVRGDALRLPFADNSFDVVVCQMFLHHLDTPIASAVLREMDRMSRRGWIAADLLRRRRASAWIRLFTLFADPMVKHDARVSVKQAWSPAEAKALGEPLEAEYRETFGHRFLLVKRK